MNLTISDSLCACDQQLHIHTENNMSLKLTFQQQCALWSFHRAEAVPSHKKQKTKNLPQNVRIISRVLHA